MARALGMEDGGISEGGGYSRVKASLASSKACLSPSDRAHVASRDEASCWLSNRAVSRESFSALEHSAEKKTFEPQGVDGNKNPMIHRENSFQIKPCYLKTPVT